MKTIVIGVMPQDKIRTRTIAIAEGAYKRKRGEPKIWFTSMRSVATVLSDSNRALLKLIQETTPRSISELARSTGLQPDSLSRALKTMARYGLVALHKEKHQVRPAVKATDFTILISV